MARFYVTSREGHIMVMDRATGEFVQGAATARIADDVVRELNASEPRPVPVVTETQVETTRNDGAYGITKVWHTTVREVAGHCEDVQVFESLSPWGRGQLISHYSQDVAA